MNVHEIGYHKKSMSGKSYARIPGGRHSRPYAKTWHKKNTKKGK